ncbi:MAG: serine/threonine protein kinase [Planctomycetes bacterium]|nr:serine/threonine protein kinase [Planctomycetota bacterium]
MAANTAYAGHPDTLLARLLHETGRLPLADLTLALNQIRAQRATDPSASLANFLVNAGAIDPDELAEFLNRPQTQFLNSRPLTEFVTPRGQGASQTLAEGSLSTSGPGRDRWQAGKRIGNYELVALLGHGGMGVVFRARHLDTGQAVAIKGLLSSDNEEAVTRFARECQAQSTVDNHPNVAQVYEAGEVDGQGYLVLELVAGGDLEALLRTRTRLPGAEAAKIVAQLARGLAHVHSHRILHRDLKPANVLFAADGTPKLVDFGLARLDRAEQLTLTGQILGTPAYMAPEQALGLNEVDERTDVYGLGAVLYTSLTGILPFDGPALEVLSSVLTADPVQPSTIAPDLDPGLEAICLRAMAKDPKDRFQSAALLAQALEDWSPATPPRDVPRSQLILFVVASLLVGFAAGLLAGIKAGSDQSAAAEPRATTENSPALSPSSPTEVEPSPTPVKSPNESPRPSAARISFDELERGTPVLAETTIAEAKKQSAAQIAWVVSITRGERTQIHLLVGEDQKRTSFDRTGFRRDAFGTGARCFLTKGVPACTILRRLGPMALIEFRDGGQMWNPVSRLTLLGEGVDPGDDASTEVVLVRWAKTYYPALVVAYASPTRKHLRVLYLEDGTMDWVDSVDRRPLPTPGTRVDWKDSWGNRQRGVVVGYPSNGIVDVARRRTNYLVPLTRVTVPRTD